MDILLIEDNKEISTMLSDFLERDGYRCHTVRSGEEGIWYLKKHPVKIILLDVMLPGMDGFEVCRQIHQEQNLPIIILSAKTDKDDKINGLLYGADDYIEKPFDVDLLLAKIHSLYRRHYDTKSILLSGDVKIDLDGRTAYYKDEPLDLTIKEYDLLVLFLQNEGKALKKEYIFDKVWGLDSFSEPSTLTVHVNWLREKIEENPKNPKQIITVWGVGYKYEAAYDTI